MAHKKAGGSTSNGRNSPGQRLGIKRFAGQQVNAGEIIVRQVGARFRPGTGVGMGKDYTIFAKIEGQVLFKRYTRERMKVSVVKSQAA